MELSDLRDKGNAMNNTKGFGLASEPQVRSSDLLAECYDYIKTLAECARMETVPDMIANVSYVYLSRKERIALAWRILKTIFR